MTLPRLRWEAVETVPSADASVMAEWDDAVAGATGTAARVHTLVGRALSWYWAVQVGATELDQESAWRRRRGDIATATDLARRDGAPDTIATALLGHLYALWGPDTAHDRAPLLHELATLRDQVEDQELRLRTMEWQVLHEFDHGDLEGARSRMQEFEAAASSGATLFVRRAELWHANLAMLTGRLDDAVEINQAAVSSTSTTAGAPLSFQNVAITVAIERFLRRGLADVVEAIRSVRASSPRVSSNWDTGLSFALAETGELDEAAVLFDGVVRDDFAAVPRDLNWLVTMQLLGLVALHLDDRERCESIRAQLEPFGELDATHGAGYASYGPVARLLGSLAARCGDVDAARSWHGFVLATRDHGPWTALTRLDAARALEPTDASAAHDLAVAAGSELRELGLVEWADVAAAVEERTTLAGTGGPVARLVDGRWELEHPEGRAVLAPGRGVDRLLRLLARPGQDVPAAVLDGDTDPSLPTAAASVPTLDAAARRAYRRRLDELESLAEVGAQGAARRREQEFLLRELAASRYTPSGSAEIERARVRVTTSMRRTLRAIEEQSPGLGAHLRRSLETGRSCLYAPSDGRAWRVSTKGRSAGTR